jgi:hypothetical protein
MVYTGTYIGREDTAVGGLRNSLSQTQNEHLATNWDGHLKNRATSHKLVSITTEHIAVSNPSSQRGCPHLQRRSVRELGRLRLGLYVMVGAVRLDGTRLAGTSSSPAELIVSGEGWSMDGDREGGRRSISNAAIFSLFWWRVDVVRD